MATNYDLLDFAVGTAIAANTTHGPWCQVSTVLILEWSIVGANSLLSSTPEIILTIIITIYFGDDAGARIVTGPAWTNDTTRNAALAYKNGWLTNAASMTGRISNNGGTTTIGTNRGLYLGSFHTTANGQTGMAFTYVRRWRGRRLLGLYNAYNQVQIVARENDTTSSYTYALTTWRQANAGTAANNCIFYLDGLGTIGVNASFTHQAKAAGRRRTSQPLV